MVYPISFVDWIEELRYKARTEKPKTLPEEEEKEIGTALGNESDSNGPAGHANGHDVAKPTGDNTPGPSR